MAFLIGREIFKQKYIWGGPAWPLCPWPFWFSQSRSLLKHHIPTCPERPSSSPPNASLRDTPVCVLLWWLNGTNDLVIKKIVECCPSFSNVIVDFSAHHSDKLCDQVSDAVLDACLAADPNSKVACETASKTGMIMVFGEITTKSLLDYQKIIRNTVQRIGFTDSSIGTFD